MSNTGTINIALKIDDKGGVKVLQTVGKESSSTGKKGKQAFNDMDKSASSFNKTVKMSANALLKMGAAAASVAVVYKLTQLYNESIKAASALEEVNSKYSVVFEGQIDTVNKWSETLVEKYAMSTRESKKYLSSVQDLLVPMGMQSKAAAKLSNEMVKLAADLGSFNDMPTQQVIENIQSALTGEYESMKKYGVVINATRVQQEALNMGLARTKEGLTAGHKAQAAYKLIVESSTAAMGDMERTADQYANTSKRMTSEWEDFTAALGAKFIGPATTAKAALADILDVMTKIIQGAPQTDILDKQISDIENQIQATIQAYNKEAKTRDEIQQESIEKLKKREERYIEELSFKRSFMAKIPFVNPEITTQAERFKNKIGELNEKLNELKETRALENIFDDFIGLPPVVDKANKSLDDTKNILNELEQEILESKVKGALDSWFSDLEDDPEKQLKALQDANQEKYALTIAAAKKVDKETWMLEEEHQANKQKSFEEGIEAQTQFEYDAEQKSIKDREKLLEKESQEQQKATQKALDDEQEANQHMYDNIHDIAADFWGEVITENMSTWDDFMDYIQDAFNDTLSEMMAQISTDIIMNIIVGTDSSGSSSITGSISDSISDSIGSSILSKVGSYLFDSDSIFGSLFSSTASSTGLGGSTLVAGDGAFSTFGTTTASSTGVVAAAGMAAVAAGGAIIMAQIYDAFTDDTDKAIAFLGSDVNYLASTGTSTLDEPAYQIASAITSKTSSDLFDFSLSGMSFNGDDTVQQTIVDYFDTVFTSLDEVIVGSVNDVLADFSTYSSVANTGDIESMSSAVFGDMLGSMLIAVLPDAGTIEEVVSTVVDGALQEYDPFVDTSTAGRDAENQQAFETVDSTFQPVYEDITRSISEYADIFNENFFDAITPEGGNEWDSLIAFAETIQDTDDFLSKFDSQMEEFGETALDAYNNILAVTEVLAGIDEGMSAISDSTITQTLETLNDSWETLIESMDDAHASVEDLAIATQAMSIDLGAAVTGLTATSLQSSISGGESIDSIMSASIATIASSILAEDLVTNYIEPLNEAVGAIIADGGDLSSVIELMSGYDLSGAQDGIDAYNELYAVIDETVETVDDLTDSKADFENNLNDIIAQNTLSDYEYSLYSLNQWYEEQTALAEELGQSLDLVDEAYSDQLETLRQTQLDEFTESLTEFNSSLDDILAQNTLSDYGYGLYQLSQWYDEQIILAEELGQSLELVNQAYDAQNNALLQAQYMTALSNEIAALQEEYSSMDENLTTAKEDYISALEDEISVQEDAKSAAEEAAASLESVIESLSDAMDIAITETYLSPDAALAAAGNEFSTAMASALAGDINSLEQLPDLSSEYLDAAKSAMTDYSEYQALAGQIYAQLAAAQDAAGDQLSEQEALVALADEQIDSMNAQIDAVNGVEDSIFSLIELEENYNQAILDFNESSLETQIEAYEAILDELESVNNNLLTLDVAETAYNNQDPIADTYVAPVSGTDFNDAQYLSDKTDQLNSIGYLDQTWTEATTQAAITAAGMTLEEHYLAWGAAEGIENPYTFAGGGTVSGSASGYTIPTTFHGIEHITPDSQMQGVNDRLDQLIKMFFTIMNLSGDNVEATKDIVRIYKRNMRNGTDFRVKVVNPITDPALVHEVA